MIKKIQQEIDQLQERLEGMTHTSMRAKLEYELFCPKCERCCE